MKKSRASFIVDKKGEVIDLREANERMDSLNEQIENINTLNQTSADPLSFTVNSKNPAINEIAKEGIRKQEYKILKHGGKAGAGIFALGYVSWRASYNPNPASSLIYTGIAIVLFVIGGLLMLEGMIATWKDGK